MHTLKIRKNNKKKISNLKKNFFAAKNKGTNNKGKNTRFRTQKNTLSKFYDDIQNSNLIETRKNDVIF